MQVDEKFNKRVAPLIKVQPPLVDAQAGPECIRVRLFTSNEDGGVSDNRTLSMHLTPFEALEFAQNLIAVARDRLIKTSQVSQKQGVSK
ncbi:hypothetical protein [Pseudomonas sp. UMAB-40]|uniref:hypothetical protein n=1 Tax=Pseudomonas sp. UMAB-40 TaxID=1365407 RepID=UPI001C57AB3A|nr:hypothetical protein [Pseudomonas sp. UMAB-40]